MGVGQPAALLFRGSSRGLGVLDLALSPWPGQFKASGGAGSKAEPGGWDPLPMGTPQWGMPGDPLLMWMPQLSGGWEATSGFYPLM